MPTSHRLWRALNGVGTALAITVCGATPIAATGTTLEQPSGGLPTTVTAREWTLYTRRFLLPSGRIVDIEKGRVSHSEGQGYGLLLAEKAGDRAAFDRILTFTLTKMRGRGDRLISWIYNPNAYPPITDPNNATDGDILIAYALLRGAVRWNAPRYLALAEPLIADIGRLLVTRHGSEVILRPAAYGFDARHDDGPVANLSYWIYGALLLFAEVDRHTPWLEAWQSGLRLTEAALTEPVRLPPDWVTLRAHRFLAPANGFAPKSSYDAVRIPLYMALGGRVPRRYFAPFDAAWNVRGRAAPIDYDFSERRTLMDMNDLGYRAIAALTACVVRGVTIPADLSRYRNTTYFSSSLHLLTLAAAREAYPHCLAPDRVRLAAHRAADTRHVREGAVHRAPPRPTLGHRVARPRAVR